MQDLAKKLKQDERVLFFFLSPSGDGLKVAYELECRGPRIFPTIEGFRVT
jgi:hypothetical protein